MCMRCGKHTPVECPEGGPAAELQRECCCRCREKRSWRKALRLKLVIFLIRQRGGKLPPFDRRLHALTESAPPSGDRQERFVSDKPHILLEERTTHER